MDTIVLTGFPGFLGSALIGQLLLRTPSDVSVTALVQPEYYKLAAEKTAALEQSNPALRGRTHLVPSDITQPDLGLGTVYPSLAAETMEVYHLAAVYGLNAPHDLAFRVNVDGTHHMLDFAAQCPNLSRFQHVSTLYVAGRAVGTFTERDLDKGQRFNNAYEETKFLAEVEVQRRMAEGFPATIYRPAVVVGDSKTGETQKYDGLYYMIQFLDRQPRVALLPVIGTPKRHELNIVPRDFVIDALTYLSGLEESAGMVYHLSDPQPNTVDTTFWLMAEATERRVIRIPVTSGLTKWLLRRVPGIAALAKVVPGAVDYLAQPSHFTCENTLRDLEGSGIYCPPFASYVKTLVRFYRAHPEIGFQAMV